MANRLANETSPYLRQHAHNPVDWYPWGTEALSRAAAEDRPILLSIGYAACHWCHVMERESFEDDATAALMNEHFVSVKVDREERPDLDGIYMQAVQAMTGRGGWPMTVFLTPDGMPFYGGTYFPPDDRPGMPSFRRVLGSMADAYRHRKADIARTAASMRELYDASRVGSTAPGALDAATFHRAFASLRHQYDARHGGFGGAPKFPPTMSLEFCLCYWARTGVTEGLEMARDTFMRMARGGIYDQIGGGFARYAVDGVWLVPHFEKMLYDNALLIRLGAHLWQATHDEEIRRVTEETIDWAAREMQSEEGGFYSSLDADSEGHEGKFYVWRLDECSSLLGADGPLACEFWGITQSGNFEGTNILHVSNDRPTFSSTHGVTVEELDTILARARRALYDARAARVWPARDDKILASWNGLMVRGVADAARAFDRADYRELAVRSGTFLFGVLVHDDRVLRSYKDGVARVPGYLEDHASMGLAALALYELTWDSIWLDRARALVASTIEWFWDDGAGVFFDTARDQEALITRPRDTTDNAQPSGTSLAIELLFRFAVLCDDREAWRRAVRAIESVAEPMARYPLAFGHALMTADLPVYGAVELAIVGDPGAEDFQGLVRAAHQRFVPSIVMGGGMPPQDEQGGLLAGRPMRDGQATAYVCRGYSCDAPVSDASRLREQLRSASHISVATAQHDRA
jgi:uncharacterized protein